MEKRISSAAYDFEASNDYGIVISMALCGAALKGIAYVARIIVQID